jgi:hypothetical protein
MDLLDKFSPPKKKKTLGINPRQPSGKGRKIFIKKKKNPGISSGQPFGKGRKSFSFFKTGINPGQPAEKGREKKPWY